MSGDRVLFFVDDPEAAQLVEAFYALYTKELQKPGPTDSNQILKTMYEIASEIFSETDTSASSKKRSRADRDECLNTAPPPFDEKSLTDALTDKWPLDSLLTGDGGYRGLLLQLGHLTDMCLEPQLHPTFTDQAEFNHRHGVFLSAICRNRTIFQNLFNRCEQLHSLIGKLTPAILIESAKNEMANIHWNFALSCFQLYLRQPFGELAEKDTFWLDLKSLLEKSTDCFLLYCEESRLSSEDSLPDFNCKKLAHTQAVSYIHSYVVFLNCNWKFLPRRALFAHHNPDWSALIHSMIDQCHHLLRSFKAAETVPSAYLEGRDIEDVLCRYIHFPRLELIKAQFIDRQTLRSEDPAELRDKGLRLAYAIYHRTSSSENPRIYELALAIYALTQTSEPLKSIAAQAAIQYQTPENREQALKSTTNQALIPSLEESTEKNTTLEAMKDTLLETLEATLLFPEKSPPPPPYEPLVVSEARRTAYQDPKTTDPRYRLQMKWLTVAPSQIPPKASPLSGQSSLSLSAFRPGKRPPAAKGFRAEVLAKKVESPPPSNLVSTTDSPPPLLSNPKRRLDKALAVEKTQALSRKRGGNTRIGRSPTPPLEEPKNHKRNAIAFTIDQGSVAEDTYADPEIVDLCDSPKSLIF